MVGPVLLIGLFVILGIVFSMGKGAFLIAGYNTMPRAEKAKYDTDALCRFMGKMMFVLALSQVFWLLGSLLETGWLVTMGIIVFVGAIVFMLVYANTGNRFKKQAAP
jgi:uncharacterized membrane protein YgdD (TMEM256/DUF423 family)